MLGETEVIVGAEGRPLIEVFMRMVAEVELALRSSTLKPEFPVCGATSWPKEEQMRYEPQLLLSLVICIDGSEAPSCEGP